eukprot:469510-Amorphochlora_amoeboformis.AAC.2
MGLKSCLLDQNDITKTFIHTSQSRRYIERPRSHGTSPIPLARHLSSFNPLISKPTPGRPGVPPVLVPRYPPISSEFRHHHTQKFYILSAVSISQIHPTLGTFQLTCDPSVFVPCRLSPSRPTPAQGGDILSGGAMVGGDRRSMPPVDAGRFFSERRLRTEIEKWALVGVLF